MGCHSTGTGLTTAIQPRAGMLSLTAERWLNILLPRFLSRKVWISWIFSDIGFRSAATSFCKQTLSTVTKGRTEAQASTQHGLSRSAWDLSSRGASRIGRAVVVVVRGKTIFILRSTKMVHIFKIITTVLWRHGRNPALWDGPCFRESGRDHRDTEHGQRHISKWNAQITCWNDTGLKPGWVRG